MSNTPTTRVTPWYSGEYYIKEFAGNLVLSRSGTGHAVAFATLDRSPRQIWTTERVDGAFFTFQAKDIAVEEPAYLALSKDGIFITVPNQALAGKFVIQQDPKGGYQLSESKIDSANLVQLFTLDPSPTGVKASLKSGFRVDFQKAGSD
jgi:hypothetical protein